MLGWSWGRPLDQPRQLALVQADIEGDSPPGSSVVGYRAWTQWVPYQNSSVVVSNFSVALSDRVHFLVTASLVPLPSGFAATYY